MSQPKRLNRNVIAALHDATMAGLSFLLSVYLRLGTEQIHLAVDYLIPGTFIFTAICMFVFVSMRLYRGLWRYASMRDLVTIIKAVTLSILVFAAAMFLFNRLEGIPRSLLFINWMLLLFMLGGPRFVYRAIKDHTLTWRMSLNEPVKVPVLLVGATDNAERFIRDMRRDAFAPYEIVGILDDDDGREGRTIHHVNIYNGLAQLEKIIEKLHRSGKRPQKIILADPQLSGETVSELLTKADEAGIPLARLPKPGEMQNGVGEYRTVQPIAVEDLLGRPQNVLDRESMKRLITNEVVLVTGAGGTIGSELTRQIAQLGPSRLLLLDSSEFNLYEIDRELRGKFPRLSITPILADVRDASHMHGLFSREKPALIFHAAAIKHVPMSEQNVEEAVLTNVFGTLAVAEAAAEHDAKAMVLISTDKAVNPSNVMGASKRLAEIFCQARAVAGKAKTQFMAVRFGNVLGSTGSVVPLFAEQLAKGGPLTVTHPDMTRYFMTVREAVELVLQAATLGAGMKEARGGIFVLDMGKPVKILDLARQMIRLAGYTPEQDIGITFTGLRPGEKLYEELFYLEENAAKTSHASIYLASPKSIDIALLRAGLDKLQAACLARKMEEVRRQLQMLVPEYAPAGEIVFAAKAQNA